MPARKQLVLFVEGEGDRAATPILVKRLISEINPTWEGISLSPEQPFLVGGLPGLVKAEGKELIRLLKRAGKLPHLGGVLLLVDGDYDRLEKKPFCASEYAKKLAAFAVTVGAGSTCSFAAVIVRRRVRNLVSTLWRSFGGPAIARRPARPRCRNDVAVGRSRTKSSEPEKMDDETHGERLQPCHRSARIHHDDPGTPGRHSGARAAFLQTHGECGATTRRSVSIHSPGRFADLGRIVYAMPSSPSQSQRFTMNQTMLWSLF